MDYIGTSKVLGKVGKSLGGLSSGTTTDNMNDLTFSTRKPSADNLTFGSLSSPDLNTDGFSGSAIQQSDLDNPQKLTFKNKWNAIPQEKKSAFAQAMLESAPKLDTQVAQTGLPQLQDFSWALQPTRGSMFYGN